MHGKHAATFRVEILDTDLVALAKHCPWFVNLCLREREREREGGGGGRGGREGGRDRDRGREERDK